MHNSNNLVLFTSIFEIIIVFSLVKNKRKYFLYTHIFIVLFSKRNECIFEMKIYSFIIKIF